MEKAKRATVCVFCGSSRGEDPVYAAQAAAMGSEIARRGLDLVYGGSAVGLMGIMAAAAMAGGARVTGIIPERINARVEHLPLSELIVVPTMHERKARMHAMADCFAALPGGIGTYEEFFEAYTWFQIGYHDKPLGLLDAGGFFAPLLALLRHTAARGFMKAALIDGLVVAPTAEALLGGLVEGMERGDPPGPRR